jgi:hypothetical protein
MADVSGVRLKSRLEMLAPRSFGFPLVSTYNSAADLVNVTLLGFDLTRMFE